MRRECKHFLEDIIESIDRARDYTAEMSAEEFAENRLVQDGVVRNLEIIGEATKSVPGSVLDLAPQIDWRRIAGMRDVIVHHYWGIDLDIVWDVVQNKLLPLRQAASAILSDIGRDQGGA